MKMKEGDIAVLIAAGVAFTVFSQSSRSWAAPISAKPYLAALHASERANGIPKNLLVRVAYQESRFRNDIISGTKQSSAGAQGIMQIVPKWHPSVDPLDPYAAINYAGAYLAKLYKRYGNWSHALMAYNWGMGNVDRYLKGELKTLPTETQNYYTQILRDVRV